jgi:hypothetical protein
MSESPQAVALAIARIIAEHTEGSSKARFSEEAFLPLYARCLKTVTAVPAIDVKFVDHGPSDPQ